MQRRRSSEGIEKALKSYEWVVGDMARRMSPVVSEKPPTVMEIERLELLSQRLGGLWAKNEKRLSLMAQYFSIGAAVLAVILEIAVNVLAGRFVTWGVFLLAGMAFVGGVYLIKTQYSAVMTIRPVLSVHCFLGLYPLIPDEQIDDKMRQKMDAARSSVPSVRRYLERVEREGRSLTQFEVKQICELAWRKRRETAWSDLSFDRGSPK